MKKTKHITRARSKKNGIIFYSNLSSFVASETFRDDSGTIHSRVVLVPLHGLNDYLETSNHINKFNWKVIAFDIILVNVCLLSRNLDFVLASIYFSIFVSFELFMFIELVYQMKSKKGKERSTAKFHAAEHMVINAYQRLQRIPTFKEVKNFSRFSKKCGSRRILYKISTHSLISLAIAFLPECNYLFLYLFIHIFMIIANYKGWLEFLQVFITTPPSDSEIELAIEGIKNFEKMEEKLLFPPFF
ncbi:MAG: DUF1385 domain-containing protein [Clostridia bacterium]|nr:DUF1385 domain-containing protein [Clostridia bacterium]